MLVVEVEVSPLVVVVVVDSIVDVDESDDVVVEVESGPIELVEVIPPETTDISPLVPSMSTGSPKGVEQLGVLFNMYVPMGVSQLISNVIYATMPSGIGLKSERDNTPTRYSPGSTI